MDETSPPQPPDTASKAAAILRDVVDKVVLLRVTTIIGPAAIKADSAVDRDIETAIVMPAPDQQLVASTTINMLLGDYTEILHPDYVAKADLAKLHNDALDMARKIRAETMETLKSLAKDIGQHF